MITSFEVGAVFRIIDDATAPLKAMQTQLSSLNKSLNAAKKSMAELGKLTPGTGLTAAVTETEALAKAWKDVAANSAAARQTISAAASASARASLPPSIGGGGRGRTPSWPGRHGGGGAHISGPGVGIPGGGHMRLGGVAAATAGMAGYAAYEAAQMEDAVWQLVYHSGQEQTEENRKRFREILQNAQRTTGFGLHDLGEAAKQEIRMFQGTPGGGLDVLPEMLRAAAIEARVKGESPEESMKALIGLAHMTKQYDPEAIKKLAPAFAFLSTANPSSLGSIEKSAGYAVPLLQSGLEIDPMQSLLLGTALTRAGATSTKSGTWLREMALRAMPGTSMMSKIAFKKHEEALQEMGLVDNDHHPTWFTNGKPDIIKMLDIAGTNAANIPVERRAAIERGLFGAQGGGGFALLADPAVREQVAALNKEMNSPEFKNRYGSFLESYNNQVTSQNARTGLQDFNVLMQDIGKDILPSVNIGLRNFKGILETVRNLLPGGPKTDGRIGGDALTGVALGAATGAVVGAFGGPVGAVGGAAIGGVLGTAHGFMESMNHPVDRFGREVINTGNSAASAAEGMRALGNAIRGLPAKPGGVFPGGTSAAPAQVELKLDGQTLGSVILDMMGRSIEHPTQASEADHSSIFTPPGDAFLYD